MSNTSFSLCAPQTRKINTALVTGASLADFSSAFHGASFCLFFCLANPHESRFLIRNRLFTPRMGDVILLSPYDYHHFISRGDGFAALRLTFSPHTAERLLFHALGGLSVGKHVLRLVSAAKYLSLTEESLQALSDTDCLALLREAEESSADTAAYVDGDPLPLLLQKSLSYLVCHYNEKVSGVFLADRYGVSPKTVDNLFRDYIGVRIGEIAERLRFVKAMELTACGIECETILSAIGVKDTTALTALIKKYQK